MDILSKITELRKSKSWSEYQLAEKSGLTQSTISSWYRKDMLPSISSLEKICNAFGISMSQFFFEDTDKAICLNTKQKKLIEDSAKLNSQQFDALLYFLQTLE